MGAAAPQQQPVRRSSRRRARAGSLPSPPFSLPPGLAAEKPCRLAVQCTRSSGTPRQCHRAVCSAGSDGGATGEGEEEEEEEEWEEEEKEESKIIT
ncbi:unnamed protein product [Prorocentrum cordatum]|uniref:Uncharacterized protein n=1 Tax=Prorocentrum cordatum TaxID=2364126 RepID=A0ABN9YE61_9DINO|nr:unnamed protein product [Polarella glacialis]